MKRYPSDPEPTPVPGFPEHGKPHSWLLLHHGTRPGLFAGCLDRAHRELLGWTWWNFEAAGIEVPESLYKRIYSLEETIDSFDRLCNGEGDDLPESAFMYVGNLDDAERKAKEMAEAVA